MKSDFAKGEPYVYQLTLKALLKKALINSPEREIVYAGGYRGTYRDLNTRIHRLAAKLSRWGVGPNQTVAVFDYDSHRFLECFFAIPMMGAVLQTVNWRLSPEQIAYTVNHAGAALIIVHEDFVPLVEKIGSQLEQVKKVVVVSESGHACQTALPVVGEYEAALADAASAYDFPELQEDTRATTFYTTGTTGNPKGVYFSHRQLVLHTLAEAVELGCYQATIFSIRSDDVYMPLTPMFHVHAWGVPYLATLLGMKQVYPGRYDPATIVRLIRQEGVTVSHCVPTILQMVLQQAAADKVDLAGWKLAIGGARLPKGLAKAARDMGVELQAGFGMSETCPLVTLANPKEGHRYEDEEEVLDTITKAGRPVPLVDVEVMDPEGNLLPHDGVSTGEVVIRAPWLTAGYHNAPDKSEELWRGGWMHSGDVGHIDADDYLLITDRIKDVIKSGGEWISTLDLESVLSRHEAVMESAAIGIPDDKWGERPMMFVTLKPEHVGQVTPAMLKAYMARAAAEGKLPRYGVPDRFEFVDTIPKTSVGKLDKKVMRSQLAQS